MIRANQHALASQALGIVLDNDGGLEFVLDQPGERDRVFNWNAESILFVSPTADHRLAGYLLDHSGSPGDERFSLEPLPSDGATDATT